MADSMGSKLALAIASGILAGLAGCGGAPPRARDVPGAPPDDTQSAAMPASSTAPRAEKHACGSANGCSASAMPKKGAEAQQAPGTPKSP
jgi:hypothetical protein